MATPAKSREQVQFAEFALDLRTGELWRDHEKVALSYQSFQILTALLQRPGEMVRREELVKLLWASNVFVDFEGSLNKAMKRLREILHDSANQPKFIETLPRRGYRFIATVARAQEPATETKGVIGRKVSHYRVLEVIGGGGMGLVYKAEDLKLGRRVALKFLPEELANDPIALHRFEREARTASSLNHPNICTIYEVEEHEAQPFIVMELLEGETLRDRLAAADSGAKAIALDELLDIALPIVRGLQAAHEKGIIHRDIKPGNIFLTAQGQVKILDFGLAKSMAGGTEIVDAGMPERSVKRVPAASAGIGQTGSIDHTVTRTGAAMGTAGYMSPEQVRGEKLDARTDIFSFGLVLYEMAAGQRAFSGETAALVRDAIVNNAPTPVTHLNSDLPAKLVIAIDKCLEKDRELRCQSAAEIRAALEEVRKVIAPSPASAQRLKRLAAASLTILLVVVCVVGIWWWRRPLVQLAFQKYRTTPLTSTGNVAFADMSPDGRYLAYADDEIGKQSLWVQQLATSTTVRVLGPLSSYLGRGLRFTSDGNYLYYSHPDPDGRRLSLYRLAVLGGTPEKILTDVWGGSVSDSGAVDVSPDGKKIVFARYTDKENYLFIANADGSAEKRLLTLPAKEEMRVLAWAPDGQTIAFGIDEVGRGSMNCIAVLSSQGGKERRILRNVIAIFGVAWLPDQSGLVFTGSPSGAENNGLWMVSYPGGGLRRVTDDLADYYGVSLAQDAGRLVTVQKQMDSSLWVAPVVSPSQAVQLREGAGKTDGLRGVAWLPDGRLVYETGNYDSQLWLVDGDGSHRRQLTHTSDAAGSPSATPAGTMIVFARADHVSNIFHIWAMDSSGSNLRQITNGSTSEFNPEVSPDGKWITYVSREGIWKVSLSGGATTELDPRAAGYPTISPEGRWIAFVMWDEKGKKNQIEVVASDGKGSARFLPFPFESQVPESTNMGPLPIRWTATGDAITYVRTQNGVSNIWSQPVDGSPAKQLTNFTSMLTWRHAWSPDGKYLVLARGNFARDAVMLTDRH